MIQRRFWAFAKLSTADCLFTHLQYLPTTHWLGWSGVAWFYKNYSPPVSSKYFESICCQSICLIGITTWPNIKNFDEFSLVHLLGHFWRIIIVTDLPISLKITRILESSNVTTIQPESCCSYVGITVLKVNDLCQQCRFKTCANTTFNIKIFLTFNLWLCKTDLIYKVSPSRAVRNE